MEKYINADKMPEAEDVYTYDEFVEECIKRNPNPHIELPSSANIRECPFCGSDCVAELTSKLHPKEYQDSPEFVLDDMRCYGGEMAVWDVVWCMSCGMLCVPYKRGIEPDEDGIYADFVNAPDVYSMWNARFSDAR